jgi:hypothetical protein
MQFKQTLVRLLFLVIPFAAYAQTTYSPEGSKEYILLNRLEIKAQKDSVLNFSKIKPFSREQTIPRLEQWDSISLSRVDQYNLYTAKINNLEWLSDSSKSYPSKRRFLKTFYKTPANLYEVNVKDFFLAVNPLFQYVVGKEKNNSENIFLNTRGVVVRGRIANKIGFATSITDNQERDPLYVQQLVTAHKAVPGQGFYKEFKTTGYDYFDARGYFTFGITKYIDVQFGYDKNFIGNGYRSLFLSDISSPMLFLKLNTRIWKFNYQNLFMELNSANKLNADQLLPKKYAAMHHLDMQFTKWLNVGLFEGIIFGRQNHFEFGYLNPIIFYRSIELQNGSFDNALVGMDAKANVAKRFQFYGQFLLDEFNIVEMRKGSGWWGNKYGYQLGVKYIDAFNIRNLDLQVESNRVRPFTYSHRDSVANYTHYNQPLAHPLGANFQELIGIVRYQPAPRWMIEAKAIYYYQGRDTGSISYGSNIFLPDVYPYRRMDYGYDVGTGIKTKVAYTSLLLSYEIKPNLYLEATGVYRKEGETTVAAAKNTSLIYFGVRWNLGRREFDY